MGTAGEIKLTSTVSTIVDTDDADFNAGTQSTGLASSGDFYVNSGNLYLKKAFGGSCTVNGECVNGGCVSGTCSYYDGSILGCGAIYIYYIDAPETYTWANRDSGCLDGGRCPTVTELACIYTNKASLGSFQSNYYWSGTETSSTDAWRQNFNNGLQNYVSKTNSYYVRCVRGQ